MSRPRGLSPAGNGAWMRKLRGGAVTCFYHREIQPPKIGCRKNTVRWYFVIEGLPGINHSKKRYSTLTGADAGAELYLAGGQP